MLNATPCQQAFLLHWQAQYNARYWGGTPGSHFKESIGDTNGWVWHGNTNASKFVFNHISKNVSGHSAHTAVVNTKSTLDKYPAKAIEGIIWFEILLCIWANVDSKFAIKFCFSF